MTAADVSAGKAETKMHPPVPGLYAVFTNVRVRAGDLDLVQMRALRSHGASDATPIHKVACESTGYSDDRRQPEPLRVQESLPRRCGGVIARLLVAGDLVFRAHDA